MSSARSLLVLGLMAGAGVSADLRMASQPDNGYNVQQRGPVQFVTKKALYMEPSDFAYQGLKDQRDGGAYDNFLRSNIDNEQDKRNFNTEAGRDMLPFRSFEGAEITDAADKSVKTKLPAGAAGTITATPGVSQVIPLRWNNPHSAELEVNVWILDSTVVIPVRKPACAGEGHQDAAFAFTIPADFNTEIPKRVPSFKGCKVVGDCVLQIYAHSVEPRQYAIGTPLIITGTLGPAGTSLDIEPARADPGTDISKQPNDFCLSSESPSADITTSVPRAARLISDVYNHAYQNSDYSPYSGQQPESISKNLQASVIISMIPANRGELGAALLKKQNPAAAAYQAQLAAKVQNLKEQYEGVVNNIIAKIGDKVMQNQDADGIGPGGAQKTAKAFRAAEVGSITTERQTTTTYVPSFQLPKDQIAAAKALVPAKYAGLITADGKVQIYQAVLNDFKQEFNKAKDTFGLEYLGPAIKTSIGTMADPKQFKKLDANNKQDNGVYAAQLAQTAYKAQQAIQNKFDIVDTSLLLDVLSAADGVLPDIGTEKVPAYLDMNAVTADRLCDSDKYVEANPQVDCASQPLGPVMFKPSPDGSTLQTTMTTPAPTTSQGTSNSNTATSITSGIAAFALSAVAAIFLA